MKTLYIPITICLLVLTNNGYSQSRNVGSIPAEAAAANAAIAHQKAANAAAAAAAERQAALHAQQLKITPWMDDKLYIAYSNKVYFLIGPFKFTAKGEVLSFNGRGGRGLPQGKIHIQREELELLEAVQSTNYIRKEYLTTNMLAEQKIVDECTPKMKEIQDKYRLRQFYIDHPESLKK